MTKERLLAVLGVWTFVWFEMAWRSLVPGGAPLLTVIGVVFYALYEGPRFGLVLGILAGFMADVLTVGTMGQEMLILGSVGFFSALCSGLFFRESALTSFVLPPLMMLWSAYWRITSLKPEDSWVAHLWDLWQLGDLFHIILNLAASLLVFKFLVRTPRRRRRAYSYHI